MSRDPAPADVVVAGLGALGSAAAWRLAEAGLRVVGLDRHRPPHALGSTHGAGRVIREGFFEAPFYVPLVRRAYEGWARLEERSGKELLRTTGAVMIGDPGGTLVRGTLEAVREHGIPHRVLGAEELRAPPGSVVSAETPGGDGGARLAPDPQMVGVLEQRAGVLHPERCVEAMLAEAARHGAELRFGTPLVGWGMGDGPLRIRVPGGEIRAHALVLAAGAWMGGLVRSGPVEGGLTHPLPLEVVRQVTHRFEGRQAVGLPVTIWEYAPDRFFYTVPEEGGGKEPSGDGPERSDPVLKVAIHYGGAPVDPDTVDRDVSPGEVQEARALVDRYLPGAAGAHLDSAVCLYTNTPDHHFVLGALDARGGAATGAVDAPGAAEAGGPTEAQGAAGAPAPTPVVVAGGGSGHAFKFAPALGELVADLVIGRPPFMDTAPFRPGRFQETGGPQERSDAT